MIIMIIIIIIIIIIHGKAACTIHQKIGDFGKKTI